MKEGKNIWFRNVLMLKSHSAGVGDILRSSAAWAAIKRDHPETKLHLLFLTRDPGYPSESLIAKHHLLSTSTFLYMPVGKRFGIRGVGLATWFNLAPKLRKLADSIKPDLIVDHEPHGIETSIVSMMLRRWCGAKTLGVSQVPGRGLLYDISSPSLERYRLRNHLPSPMDYTDRDFVALSALGVHRNNQNITLQETPDGSVLKRDILRMTGDNVFIIGLNIGCGTPDAVGKRPDINIISDSIRCIMNGYNCYVLLTGADFEYDINENFIAVYDSKFGASKRIINMAGKSSLSSLTGLISACDLFISSDSGPYHMAVALNKPCIAIFNNNNSAHFHINENTKILVKPTSDEVVLATDELLSTSTR